MAARTRSEIVALAAGGIFLAAVLAAAAWVIVTRDGAGRERAEVAVAVEFAAPEDTSLEQIDALVMPKLEQHLGAAEGLQYRVSLARSGGGGFILKFKPDVGEESATAAARAQLARAQAAVPATIKLAAVPRRVADTGRIAHIGLSSEVIDRMELTRLAERLVKPRLQEIAGVGGVRILGGLHEELRIRLDKARLAAYGLSPAEIEAALRALRIEMRTVQADGDVLEVAVPATRDPGQLEMMKLGERQGAAIHLRDVATIRRDGRSDGIAARFNGRRGLILEVIKRPEADAGDVSRGVRARAAVILPILPRGVRYEIGYACFRCVAPPER